MKKLLAIIISVILLATAGVMLVGCGDTSPENEVRIARWAAEWEKEILQEWTAEFEAENPDITIKWEFKAYSTHFDTLRTDLLSGLAADIIFVNNWGWGPYQDIDVFENLGAVQQLDAVRESIMPSARDRFKQGDKVIGIPIGLVTRVPVVNVDIWESSDLGEVPTGRTEAYSYTELVDIFETVCDSKEIQAQRGINMTLTDALNMFCASAGVPIFVNGQINPALDSEVGYEAVRQFIDFHNSGMVVKYTESGGGKFGEVDNTLLYGTTAAGWGNFGTLRSYTEEGYNVATIAPFKAATNDIITESQDVAIADFNTLVVPKFSTKKDLAYRVIEWMLSKEQQLKYASFCDIPVNQEAFDTIMSNEDGQWKSEWYSAYKIGIDNLYLSPVTSTEYSAWHNTQLKKLCSTTGNYETLLNAAKAYCKALVEEGPTYL